MAVEKMKFVSITGPIKDYDRIAVNYIVGKEIHVENLFEVIDDEEKKYVKPFETSNEYSEGMRLASKLTAVFSVSEDDIPLVDVTPDLKGSVEFLTSLYEKAEAAKSSFSEDTDRADVEIAKIWHSEYENICRAYSSVKLLFGAYEVKKLSGCMKHTFFVAGWVPESGFKDFAAQFDKEKNVIITSDEADALGGMLPPTKLKNKKIFRPFQSFVEMYGLPSYNEIDPTALFAVTYTLMFGMMYGDLGHGFVLALVGAFLAKKKNFLGNILVCCGICSMLFGVLFSSVFGYENLFWHAVWEPMNQMMPTLIVTVALGVLVITAAMVMNILNGIKQKDPGRIFFDPNGIAGMVFYWTVIIAALCAFSVLPFKISATVIALLVGVPVVLMFLKEPLGKLLKGRKDFLPKNKGGYILDTFFEMFELMLSYITNTVSFIRVGAFALNHAGMMQVVFTLSSLSGGSENIFVIILGNAVVLGLEGLLVAIQVLRLQFYEMFSRYYDGSGRPFKRIGGK